MENEKDFLKELAGDIKRNTRKIAGEVQQRFCNHPEHNPPSHYCFEPGTYEHTCPKCGAKKIFTVPKVTM